MIENGAVTGPFSFSTTLVTMTLEENTVLQVAIRDTDKTPMWSLPGTKLFLSYEAPGPIDVDIQVLTLDQKKIIAQDISRLVLVAKQVDELHAVIAGSNTNDPIYKGGKGSTAKSYSKIKLVRDEEEGYNVAIKQQIKIPEILVDPMEERKHVLKDFLDKHVATVKKEIPGRSLSELRILRDLEATDKNRASVMKLIDMLISKAQAEVFNSIQKSFNPMETKVTPQDLPRQYLENVTSVLESESEDITIKLGADDDE